jgi:hypothetical protein
VTLTIPPGLCTGGDIAEKELLSGFAFTIALDMYRIKAMLDEGPSRFLACQMQCQV